MPAWSTAVASELLKHALRHGDVLDQSRIQKLVYIAHGLRLAITGHPLTGDRPEAWSFGPVYRRVADALRSAGNDPLTSVHFALLGTPETPDLDRLERELIARVHQDYRAVSGARLSYLTQRVGTPWADVYAGGKGEWRDIPHNLIKNQFFELASAAEIPPRGS